VCHLALIDFPQTFGDFFTAIKFGKHSRDAACRKWCWWCWWCWWRRRGRRRGRSSLEFFNGGTLKCLISWQGRITTPKIGAYRCIPSEPSLVKISGMLTNSIQDGIQATAPFSMPRVPKEWSKSIDEI
jgi:hypothetical protein